MRWNEVAQGNNTGDLSAMVQRDLISDAWVRRRLNTISNQHKSHARCRVLFNKNEDDAVRNRHAVCLMSFNYDYSQAELIAGWIMGKTILTVSKLSHRTTSTKLCVMHLFPIILRDWNKCTNAQSFLSVKSI